MQHLREGTDIESRQRATACAFISYAHDDAPLVRDDLAHLEGAGVPVWFDERIPTGVDWREDIAGHIAEAACVISFVSARTLASRYCRQEVLFALDEAKPILLVMLEDVELSAGLRMALRDRQALHRDPTDLDGYRAKLLASARRVLEEGGSSAPADGARRQRLVLRTRGTETRVPDGLAGEYTIGRDASCHLTLDSGFVSRVHAYVRRAGDGFVFGDRSKNGSTLVDARGGELRVHAQECPLPDAGALEIGDQLVEFELLAMDAGATRPER